MSDDNPVSQINDSDNEREQLRKMLNVNRNGDVSRDAYIRCLKADETFSETASDDEIDAALNRIDSYYGSSTKKLDLDDLMSSAIQNTIESEVKSMEDEVSNAATSKVDSDSVGYLDILGFLRNTKNAG